MKWVYLQMDIRRIDFIRQERQQCVISFLYCTCMARTPPPPPPTLPELPHCVHKHRHPPRANQALSCYRHCIVEGKTPLAY